MEYILAQGVQAHLPPSQCQGFFSGLTKLSEDELKNGKGTMKIKDTGSLKVRTPTPVRARTRDNSGALAMPLCRGRNVAARAGRARGSASEVACVSPGGAKGQRGVRGHFQACERQVRVRLALLPLKPCAGAPRRLTCARQEGEYLLVNVV